MDAEQVAALRALLAPTGWLEQTAAFARALRRSRTPGGLLVVGTPAEEPWHLTAHLAEESRLAGLPGLAPTLVRWAPPPDAPPHLRTGVQRLEQAARGETVLVVSAGPAPAPLLERVEDARKRATVLALDQDDPELDQLAHEVLAVPRGHRPGVLRRRPAPGQLGGRPARRGVPPRVPAVAEPRPRHGQRPRPRLTRAASCRSPGLAAAPPAARPPARRPVRPSCAAGLCGRSHCLDSLLTI